MNEKFAKTDKQLIIVAGANGSGKTTFAIPYTKEKGYAFLNADEIAKELEEQGQKQAMIKAGRIFFKNLHEWLDEGKSFVVETTLSGTYINKVAAKAIEKGYTISIIYIFLESADLCVQRVQDRVQKGGHDVPIVDIKRRYGRSLINFWDNFMTIAVEWRLIYNGENGFQLTALGRNNKYSVENILLFKLFKSIKKESL